MRASVLTADLRLDSDRLVVIDLLSQQGYPFPTSDLIYIYYYDLVPIFRFMTRCCIH